MCLNEWVEGKVQLCITVKHIFIIFMIKNIEAAELPGVFPCRPREQLMSRPIRQWYIATDYKERHELLKRCTGVADQSVSCFDFFYYLFVVIMTSDNVFRSTCARHRTQDSSNSPKDYVFNCMIYSETHYQ